jgi:hypothetical protein
MPAPDLEGPPPVPELAYIVGWFGELSETRISTGFGIGPISYGEIRAWARLNGIRPTPFELALLRRIDRIFLANVKNNG